MIAKNTQEGYYLLAFQAIAHIALIWGIFNLAAAYWIYTSIVYFIVASLGVSITYHRLLSHKSWNAPAWWYYIGSLCGFWGLVGSPLAWSNNHVAHHKYTDTINDPHSPITMPWWKVQWFSMLTTYPKFRFSLSNINPFQIFIHRNYFKIHLLILSMLLFFFGLDVTVAIYLAPAAIVWNMGSLVNTINHSQFGYRNEDTPNSSVNNLATGYLVFGEGWHNNHHKYPGRAKFGTRWFEVDMSYWCIKLIQKLR